MQGDGSQGQTPEKILAMDVTEVAANATQKLAKYIQAGRLSEDNGWELCLEEARKEIEALRTRVDEILFYKWDPIGVSNSNWARDEYDSYAPNAVKLALESASPHPLADYLTHVSTELMELEENRERDARVAELIFSLAQHQDHFPDHSVVEVE